MTVSEMIDNFLVEYGMVLAVPAPSFTDSEILFFLNKGQNDLVFDLYSQGDTFVLNDSDLIDSYTFASPALSSTLPANSYELALSSATRYKYYLNSYSTLTRRFLPTITSGEKFKNHNIPKTEAANYEVSSANSAIFRNPKLYKDGATIVVMVDSYSTATAVFIEFVKEPKTLVTTVASATTETTTSELRADYHDKIVSKAVQYAQVTTSPEKAAASVKLDQTI